MRDPISFERKQRLRLRPRGHDRDLVVEVVAAKGSALWVQVAETPFWLEDHHLEGGVDLAFWQNGTHHVAEQVTIVAFDLDRGRLHLRRPTHTRIVQRRRTFRETVEIPVWVYPAAAPEETTELEPLEAVSQDIGGGGICIQGRPELAVEVDDELQLELELPFKKVRARGRVRWRHEHEGRTRLGVAFTRITEREQDSVYGFLFDVQRNRLRASA